MATYLLTHNPKHSSWSDIAEAIRDVEQYGIYQGSWSCGNTRKIREGDRVFLIRLGVEPRGIFASGWGVSEPYADAHWEDTTAEALYIDVEFDAVLDPDLEPILGFIVLKAISDTTRWSPQRSGITIPSEVASELEKEWSAHLSDLRRVQAIPTIPQTLYPDELPESPLVFEGAAQRILVNRYERDPAARSLCLEAHGLKCCICGFDFEEVYGEIGRGFIHVHHLVPLSMSRTIHELNPVQDLRPVCPNCHAMLHRKSPPYSIAELRRLITSRQPMRVKR